MGGWSKAIGAGLGWFIGGPIGAMAGYFIGGAVGGTDQKRFRNPEYRQHILFTNILAFMAAIVKADKKVTASEKREVINILDEMFGLDYSDSELSQNMFDRFLNTPLDIPQLCTSYRNVADKKMCLILVEILFRIAFADKEFHPAEESLIEQIAKYLDISEYELRSIKSRYSGSDYSRTQKTQEDDLKRSYDILEMPYNASKKEIKESYRKLIVKYHPDKFGDIHPVAKNLVAQKAAEINVAYEKLIKGL